MDLGSGTVSVFSISVLMVITALIILIFTIKKGYIKDLKKGAMIPFEEDEPVGEPTDQLFKESDNESD
ncbi:hypothetical protein [Gracilimonas sp.]|uniref:hypothetical protein n=1 Tax=Gracilimonas sp. TaxID=1974203 RepID=UPI0028726FF5|nr:hypothetical protein [Gracilimonas sp.]